MTTQVFNEQTNEPVLRVNVIKAVSYDVEEIINTLREDNRDSGEELEITLDDVLEYIDTMVDEDFYSTKRKNDLMYLDQDDNEL